MSRKWGPRRLPASDHQDVVTSATADPGCAQDKRFALMVDRSNRSSDILLRSARVVYGAPPQGFTAPPKKAPNKNHDSRAKRWAKRERIEDRGLEPPIGDPIDVHLFRPALARRAGEPRHRQAFRAGARLSLG